MQESDNEDQQADNEIPEPDPKVDEYYVVKFVTQHKAVVKLYIGQIQDINNETITCKFMRRRTGKDGDHFVFPPIDDIYNVDIIALQRRVTLASERRGRFLFVESVAGTL